ncbi:hypothetical protein GINT2_002024 [Glugoides intestinalis]
MKFTPTNVNFVFEPITTPNKNIQSYFMRSEQSFYTPEELKYPAYPSKELPIQFLIADRQFLLNGVLVEQDFIVNSKMNIQKYSTIQKCIDGVYTLIFNHLKKLTSDGSFDKVKKRLTPVQLIISDFFGRSDIVALIDIVLNQLGFKAIMILPLSLCLSINLNQSYAAFIYDHGFSFIDDFCLIDTCCMQETADYPKIRPDDEDFAEEYSRLTIFDENMNFSCDNCGHKEDSEEKIKLHIQKEHCDATFFQYIRKSDFSSNFADRMKYLFYGEKLEKISKKIYSINCTFDGAESIENLNESVLAGAQLFSTLDFSKELWMTDHEWRNVRIRILKEKVLFYI